MNPPTCPLPDPVSKRLIVRFDWPLLLACGILLTGLPVHAASFQISGALPMGGDVSPGFRISPDGSSVLYIADQAADDVGELFRVPVDGGTPAKVSGDLVAGGAVSSFQISQGGSSVAYIADALLDDVNELFWVPIGGGTPQKLNNPLVAGGDVHALQISPDGSRVVYTADQIRNDVIELISVPTGAGTTVKLNGALVAGGDVSSFQISPDSERVMYLADQVADGVDELFSVPIGGGTPVKINEQLVAGGTVSSFRISPDGSRVVIVADQVTDDVNEIFSVPAETGPSVRLNGALVAGGDVSSDFEISPDGTLVVYVADQEADGVDELFSVPIDGGTPLKLNGTLVAGGSVSSLQISSDGSRVMYLADQVTDEVDELFSVLIDGGNLAQLSGVLVAGGNVSPDFQVRSNGTSVVYLADQVMDEVFELFVAYGPVRWLTSGGGAWDRGGNWESGVVPSSEVDVTIDVPAVVTLTGGPGPTTVNSLTLGGGTGTSVLQLLKDLTWGDLTVLAVADGVTLLDGGVVSGDGILACEDWPLAIAAGAEVRASTGDLLRLTTGPVDNAGSIQALGGTLTTAEIEFSGVLTNQASTGFITGHDATLRFGGGITNAGFFTLGRGFNDIFGDITNQATGSIVVSGGAMAVFYDDVANSGSIQVSASGPLQSMAVFFGNLGGNGVSGGGIVFIEGDARPGFSAGTMSYGGDVSFGPSATLHMEVGGTSPGTEYDQLSVTGNLALGGTLEVSLINGFVPTAGMSFDVWNAGTSSGGFASLVLPPLPDGLSWNSSQVNSTGVLSVGGGTQDNYAAFATLYGLTEPAEGDDDGDGLSNLEEYGLGLNPQSPDLDGQGIPRFLKNGPNSVISFDMPAASAPDIEMEIQSSLDLLSWTGLATRTAGGPWTGTLPPATSAPVAGMHTVTLTHPDGGEPRRFYRLLFRLLP